jgi:ubiquinone/menaquinone biosynthesis C-methylase UbiE
MGHFYSDLNNPEVVSVIDELSLWSAPFGLRLLDVIHYKGNMKALDIGCGLGFPLLELAMRLGDTSKVYGIDPWKAGIDRIRQKINIYELSSVDVVEGQAEEMPFEDNSFDLVVSNNGINNVKDLEKTLEECCRVSKTGAQFVFTFNTGQTFAEFYEVYREVLRDCGLQEREKQLSEHIYSKRKPVSEFENNLENHGFKVTSTYHDVFRYNFTDATAMLNHFFFKLAFIPSWKEIISTDCQEEIFGKIKAILNSKSAKSDGFSMQVPFVTMDCEKV